MGTISNLKKHKGLLILGICLVFLILILCIFMVINTSKGDLHLKHRKVHVEFGEEISTNPKDYLDLSKMNANEQVEYLKNVKVVCKRAEDYINENQREKYDFVVSRAVSKLNILLELSIPYLIVNGKLVAYKGLNYKEEILDSTNALKELNSTLIAINEDILDFTTENRFNLIIQKNKSTSNKYPRLYKEIKKRPL